MNSRSIEKLKHLFAVLMLGLISGCDVSRPAEADEDEASATSNSAPAAAPEAEATQKLKTVLDAWVFGDDLQKLRDEHADIVFMDYDVVSYKLMRYELGPARSIASSPEVKRCEVAVTLVFQSKAGTEVKRSKRYMADWMARDNKWHITAKS